MNPPGNFRTVLLFLSLAGLFAQAQMTVSIVTPTNNQVFYGTNTVSVVAETSGSVVPVTNVQLYEGTNLIGQCADASCFVVLSNWPPATNNYVFSAVAADSSGGWTTSTVVSVSVRQGLPISAGPVLLNSQTGTWQQNVWVTNATVFTLSNGFRLYVATTPTTTRVYNATGTNTSGVRFIDSPQALPPGGSRMVQVVFAFPAPSSTSYVADPLPFNRPKPVVSVTFLASDGVSVVQFPTTSNWLYLVQFSSELPSWKTLPGVVSGTGARMTKTNSEPAAQKFFRAVALP